MATNVVPERVRGLVESTQTPHTFREVSFIILNLKAPQGEVLATTAEGYDQVQQVNSIERLSRSVSERMRPNGS